MLFSFEGSENDCKKSGPKTPATVAYFSLDSLYNQDYYQISLMYGFNVPIEIQPINHPNQTYNALGDSCVATGCKNDLKAHCPATLASKDVQNQHVVACKSACKAFGIFNASCPNAKTYLHDMTSPNYCASHSVRFNVNFCLRQN